MAFLWGVMTNELEKMTSGLKIILRVLTSKNFIRARGVRRSRFLRDDERDFSEKQNNSAQTLNKDEGK